jgi:O-antigen/teichoic acid export membrane protein
VAEVVLFSTGASAGVLLARSLGPAQRGALAAVAAWPTFLLTVFSFGIPQSAAFFVAQGDRKNRQILYTFCVLILVQAVLLGAIGPWLFQKVFSDDLGPHRTGAILYLAAIPFAAMGGVFAGILQGAGDLRAFNRVRMGGAVLYLSGVGLLCALGRMCIWNVVLLLCLQILVSNVAGLLLSAKYLQATGTVELDFLRTVLAYGLKTQLAHGGQVMNSRADQLIMSLVLRPEELGFYAIAVAAAAPITLASSAIARIALPDVAQRSSDAHVERLLKLVRASTVCLLTCVVPALFVLPIVIPFLFGSGFAKATPAAMVLAVSAVFLGTNEVLSEGLRAMNRPGTVAAAQWLGLAVTGPALYLLLPKFGATGAALSSLLAYNASFLWLLHSAVGSVAPGWRAAVPRQAEVQQMLLHAYRFGAAAFARQRSPLQL